MRRGNTVSTNNIIFILSINDTDTDEAEDEDCNRRAGFGVVNLIL